MAEAPMAVWLLLGPQSIASVNVSFPGTSKSFRLTRQQFARLCAACDAGREQLARDEGERQHRVSINLLQGIDA